MNGRKRHLLVDTLGWLLIVVAVIQRRIIELVTGVEISSRARIGPDLVVHTTHGVFIAEGPALRLTTFGRAERPDYPDYQRLLLETDLSGRRASYLAREQGFQRVKALQERNLIVPVVGDLAGPKAVRAIGRYLDEHDLRVAAFYTSNVEQYLFQDGTFPRFARNLEALPHDERSVIIRSYFPYGRPHPQAVPGYLSVQLLQTFEAVLAIQRSGAFRSYGDLVTRGLLPAR